ncbi:MAG: flagellar biosynthetic protein FliQ [Planctomycetes bacterium]|nr:flagellar biosynthetic protein FliQ [Planctomycetota bacterium]
MVQSQILHLAQQALLLALMLSAPAVLGALLVGLLLSLIQAATQLQEQTLVTAAKIVVVNLVLIVLGFWMLDHVRAFCVHAFEQIAGANL